MTKKAKLHTNVFASQLMNGKLCIFIQLILHVLCVHVYFTKYFCYEWIVEVFICYTV